MPFAFRRPTLVVFAALSGVGCSFVLGEPPTHVFSLTIRVESDDGSPVSGAEIGTAETRPIKTDGAGHATLSVTGREGDRRAFLVRCPKEFQSPAQPLVIALHQSAAGKDGAVYTATCVPFKRTVVVAVRLDGGPGLPIHYLDEEVARTDESGAAHFVVEATPGEPFRVVIKTQAIDEDLRPIDPTAELSVGRADDIVLVEQKISRVVRKAPVPRAHRKLPQRL